MRIDSTTTSDRDTEPVPPVQPTDPKPADPAKPAKPADPAKPSDDGGGGGPPAEPLEWDGKFAAIAGGLIGLVLIVAMAALAYLAHWMVDNESSSRDAVVVVILALIAVGLILALLGAYLGLLEARGRARALRGATERGLTVDAAATLKTYLEEVGKMPTARALIAVGGLAFVAATAFAWHALPDSSEQQPPSIDTQPLAVKAKAGGTASFQVAASGTDLAYEWKRDGKRIARAADSPKLSISPVRNGENDDLISVVVSNDFGDAASKDAKLKVLP